MQLKSRKSVSSNMTWFVKLPDVVVRALLTQWFRLVNICRLDSAFCAHDSRKLFLDVAFEANCLYDNFRDSRQFLLVSNLRGDNMLRWMVLRKMQSTSLHLISVDKSEVEHILRTTGCSLRKLFVYNRAYAHPLYFDDVWSDTIERYCSTVVDLGISCGSKIALQQLICILQWCTQLVLLTLKNLEFIGRLDETYRCYKRSNVRHVLFHRLDITDDALYDILSLCPLLAQLEISNCDQIGDKSIGRVVICCSGITDLRLKDMFITDNAVVAIGAHCPNLRHLELIGTTYLSDASLVAIGRGCPRLTHFSELCGGSFNFAAYIELTAGCTKLVSFAIAPFEQTTELFILELISHCPMLLNLSISVYGYVSEKDFRAIRSHFAHMAGFSYQVATLKTAPYLG